MNLILSDVEETILIVDQPEGAPDGQHTVNVSVTDILVQSSSLTSSLDGKAQDGHALRAWGWCHPGASYTWIASHTFLMP